MTVSKLISWNIGSRVKPRSAQLEWIASEQADPLTLQEVVGASDLQQGLGGLISYGPDVIDQFHRAAGYVDRILLLSRLRRYAG